MTKHTPEWHVEYDHDDDAFCEICDSQNEPIAVVHAGGYRPISEDHDNARLIAASPSMHHTLEGIARTSLEFHPEYKTTQSEATFYKHQLIGVIQSAKIAIRKARGE